jgi:hypothetical protein
VIRTVTGIVVVTAVVLLGGCGNEDPDPGGGGSGGETGETTTAGPNATVAEGPLAGLDGDKLCGMVDLAKLEEAFGEPFAEALGGVNPPEQDGSVLCNYQSQAFMDAEIADLEDKLQVTTKLTFASEATTAQEALDAALVDVGGTTVAYQPVDGLGAAAGYAGSELNVGSGGSHLAAIVEVGGEFVEIQVKADPQGTIEQLRPVMDELFPKVESELR